VRSSEVFGLKWRRKEENKDLSCLKSILAKRFAIIIPRSGGVNSPIGGKRDEVDLGARKVKECTPAVKKESLR